MENMERMERTIVRPNGKNGKKGKWKTVLNYFNLRKEVRKTYAPAVAKNALSDI